MGAFVNAFAVAPQIYHNAWALAEHMGVIIGILTIGAIIIWLAYVLNSSLEMASHNENKSDDNQAQTERGQAFKSGVAKMSDGSFGNDPLENKNSLKGLVVGGSPQFRYQGVRPGMTNRPRFGEFDG